MRNVFSNFGEKVTFSRIGAFKLFFFEKNVSVKKPVTSVTSVTLCDNQLLTAVTEGNRF